MPATAPAPPPKQIRPDPFLLSVERYHAMVANGTLTTMDRVELIDGNLVEKMSQNSPHSSTLDIVEVDIRALLPAGWWLRSQKPLSLARSVPEPDAAIVRGDRHTYRTRHPVAADVGIVIEVSDSSLWYDRTVKGHLYAAADIPEYWVVNIEERLVEVYTSPNPAADPPAYATRTDYAVGQSVPLVLDGTAVAQLPVADLLP